jgi:hypothetical protein
VFQVSDFLRLRALEQAASAHELEDAEDKAALADWCAREADGRPHTFRTTRCCGGSAWPGEPPGHLRGPRLGRKLKVRAFRGLTARTRVKRPGR